MASAQATTEQTVAQLDALHDIVVPEPVSWMPQTAGWLLLLLLLLLVVGWVLRRHLRLHRANRYRREALAMLAGIEAELNDPGRRAVALAELAALVKRTALTVAPRSEVASLVGEAWRQDLDASYGGTAFTQGAGRLLDQVAYRTPASLAESSDRELAELVDAVRDWIRRHRVPGPDGATRAPGARRSGSREAA